MHENETKRKSITNNLLCCFVEICIDFLSAVKQKNLNKKCEKYVEKILYNKMNAGCETTTKWEALRRSSECHNTTTL